MADALFKKIRLATTKLGEMRKFYGETLGFPVIVDGENQFAIQVGSSVLEFHISATVGQPLYHYAMNIPENQIEDALAWAQERIEIVVNPSTGHPIFEFAHWNAHAFYFLDPEGNIGEVIARHTMGNASSKRFEVEQVECVSELGVATSNVPLAAQLLADKFGLLPYPDPNASSNEEFQAVGSESGMFIVAKKGRMWLSSDQKAGAFPASV
ncbi:MAG: glyoxalase/bleomycin resistance/dioxygenase family protein, partial [Chlorobia bacterium]|nr:glyoxalase/bleomycin resistance/dioxygenase family protein [Fimbriimonadaceae bacterium]